MTRSLRIVSGLLLFTFVTLHLTNLAIAVFSIELAEASRPWFMLPFTNPVGGMLLIASSMVHMILGLQTLYKRNTLRMTSHDTVQLVSAFLIPPLLIPHVWGLIGASELLGITPTYLGLFKLFWIDLPLDGLRQVLLIVVVWVHGCIGLFTWLRLKPWWTRFSSIAYPLAVAIPVMAMLGFVEGGNHVIDQPLTALEASNTLETQETQEIDPATLAENYAFIIKTKWQLIFGYLGLLLIVLVVRYLRLRSTDQFVEVHYADGSYLKTEVGPTLLEISNMNDVPHANLCRGRGRCGTCRIRIVESSCELAAPSDIEQATLRRTNSSEDTRLACQLSPGPGTIHIERLLPPDIQPGDLHADRTTTVQRADPIASALSAKEASA